MTKDEEKAWIAHRNEAFETDDLTWATKMLPNASSPVVVEMAFHKARYDCVAVSEEKRIESQAWLAERGLSRIVGGDPVQIQDSLPV